MRHKALLLHLFCQRTPKSIENFGFRCFFVAKTLKKVWVKMWVNCLTHTETHTRKYPDRSKEYRRGSFCLLSGIFAFSAYMTCAMKLPIVCAASSCFCLVAWGLQNVQCVRGSKKSMPLSAATDIQLCKSSKYFIKKLLPELMTLSGDR